jgi:hypothetical protein
MKRFRDQLAGIVAEMANQIARLATEMTAHFDRQTAKKTTQIAWLAAELVAQTARTDASDKEKAELRAHVARHVEMIDLLLVKSNKKMKTQGDCNI